MCCIHFLEKVIFHCLKHPPRVLVKHIQPNKESLIKGQLLEKPALEDLKESAQREKKVSGCAVHKGLKSEPGSSCSNFLNGIHV